jgi:hypothetical protein
MNEMLAGYASYTSTEAVLSEAHVGQWAEQPDTTSITVTYSCITATCTVTVTWSY